MTNIIAHLRQDRPLSWEDRLEAADEITRLREENARLRAVIQFILDNQISERRSEHIDCVIIHGEPIRAARAAIREGGND